MTLSELKAMDKTCVSPRVASSVLGCDEQWLRQMAKERPDRLPFPSFVVSNNRVKFPRLPLISYLETGVSVYDDITA